MKNNVAVNVDGVALPEWIDALVAYVHKVLKKIEKDNWELSILLCTDKVIKRLNKKYRNKAGATDVLSFELGIEECSDEGKVKYYPGDIVISMETLHENARYFNISEDEELRRLVIHGILHLNGMDHYKNDEGEEMIALQEAILSALNAEHILPEGVDNGG